MGEKIKDVMEKAAGVLNMVTGSATLLVGICMGVFMLLYGRKILKKKKQ